MLELVGLLKMYLIIINNRQIIQDRKEGKKRFECFIDPKTDISSTLNTGVNDF